MSKSSGDRAAIAYDEDFRRWRQHDLKSCPRQLKNIELFQEALAQDIEHKFKTKNQPFRGPNAQPKHRYCFSYNNNGFYKTKGCPHPNVCQICAARHPKRQCPKFKQGNGPQPPSTKQGANLSLSTVSSDKKL
jgi:hypothetical protein